MRSTIGSVLMLLLFTLVGCGGSANVASEAWGREQASPYPTLVSHALGGIDGVRYTNSREALLENYALGHRWFEVDLTLTKDEHFVCFHPGHEDEVGISRTVPEVTRAQFLRHSFRDTYTLLSLEDLFRLMTELPDARLVTDTKGWSSRKLAALLAALDAVDPSLFERVVPQIYSPQDWQLLQRVEAERGRWQSPIFTLYRTQLSNDRVLAFVREQEIPIVTLSHRDPRRQHPSFTERLDSLGVHVYAHTVNTRSDATRLAQQVDGYYTDFLAPR